MDYQEQYLKLHKDLHDSDSKDKIDAIMSILPVDFKPKSILDVACGSGKILLEISKRVGSKKNVGLDISKKIIDTAKDNDKGKTTKWIVSDIFNYNERGFNLVLAIDIIEHLGDDKMFLEKLAHLGEFFVMKVPIEHNFVNDTLFLLSKGKIDPLKDTEFRYGHIQHYGMESFITLIQQSSLKIIKLDYIRLPKRNKFFWEALRWVFLPVWFFSKRLYVKFNGGFVLLLLRSDFYGKS